MPIAGQTPLTSITLAKELKITYQPLLLANITFSNGQTLFLATENLDSTEGGPQYLGNDYRPRMMKQSLGAVQAVAVNGIVQSPQITLTLADADKALFQFELSPGWKGAKVVLFFVFWDAGTSTFSSDQRVVFVGTVNAPTEADDQTLTILATNILNLANFNLPTIPISQLCPWVFPQQHSDRVAAALDPDSDFFECGYSPDVTDADGTGGTAAARGNLGGDNPDGTFSQCGYTRDDCIARMGNIALPTSSTSSTTYVQIERDQSNRPTGTFGGITYDPPNSWRGHAYVTGNITQGTNQTNDGKYNEYIPFVYGQVRITPPVMNVLGDPNTTRFEVVICFGEIHDDPTTAGPVVNVIVNDILVPFVKDSQDITEFRWQWINGGSKFGGCNRDAPWNATGDPYGSLAAIEIVVPIAVQDSSSLPTVQVLTSGPKLRAWNSTDPTDFTRITTNNCSWILADFLTWCGNKPTDLDLQSFIDEAATCGIQVSYTDLLGNIETHDRYQFGIAIRQRRAAGDILNLLLPACKGILSPSASGDPTKAGLLKFTIKQTIGDQQPTVPLGSNNSAPFVSADGADSDLTETPTPTPNQGYSAYSFSDANGTILRQGPTADSPSSFKLSQRPFADTPNRVGVQYQDEDYQFVDNTLTLVDSEDVSRIGQQITGGVAAEGLINIDQTRRTIQTQLAEQFRGNPRSGLNGQNDTGGTWIASFDTNFKAIFLQVGQIIDISYAKYGLMSQLFRIMSISPSMNAEKITITAQWHEDDWYLDSYGQNPDPILQSQRQTRLLRPPWAWQPNITQVDPNDSIYDPSTKKFSLAQLYQANADQTVSAILQVQGMLPVNKFSQLTSPPYTPSATGADSGGNLPDGVFYLALVAIDSVGQETAYYFPFVHAAASGGGIGSVELVNIFWQSGTAGYKLFGSLNPNLLTLQKTGTGTPSSVTMSDFVGPTESMPDVEFDHLVGVLSLILHAGVFGAAITDVTSTTLRLAGQTFSTNEWQGRDVTILGRLNNSDPMPIWDFSVISNDADTFTFGAGIDFVAMGVKPGDVFIMTAMPTGTTPNTVTDAQWVNEVDYFNPPITIVDASNTAPIVITTSAPNLYVTGDKAMISGVTGNNAANGTFATITVIDSTHFSLDGSTGSGDYAGGGSVSLITNGLALHQEQGNIFYAYAGKGSGLRYKIIDNDHQTLTLDVGSVDLTQVFDGTTRFYVLAPQPLQTLPAPSVQNSDPTTVSTMQFPVDNYDEQAVLVQMFTSDASGNLSTPATSPQRAIWVFGGTGNLPVKFDKATFNIAVALPLAVDTDVAPHYIVRQSGTPSSCSAQIKIPPIGSDAIVDIILTKFDASFTGSIFGSTKLVIPANSTDIVLLDSTFFITPLHFDLNDVLTINVTQVGSTQPGQVLAFVLKWAVD